MSDETKLNLDTILASLTRVSVQTKKSERTGNDYTQINLHFHDGYVYSGFLNNEQQMHSNTR
jgi:hypothetical protein